MFTNEQQQQKSPTNISKLDVLYKYLDFWLLFGVEEVW